ncbi:MAG TPA: YbdD/YjiX family protein [Halioglobus sp.]
MKTLLQALFRRTAQTLRLMVGVGDYNAYLEHSRLHHPDLAPMSRSDYFRYCQSARYPTKDGKIKRCPC